MPLLEVEPYVVKRSFVATVRDAAQLCQDSEAHLRLEMFTSLVQTMIHRKWHELERLLWD